MTTLNDARAHVTRLLVFAAIDARRYGSAFWHAHDAWRGTGVAYYLNWMRINRDTPQVADDALWQAFLDACHGQERVIRQELMRVQLTPDSIPHARKWLWEHRQA